MAGAAVIGHMDNCCGCNASLQQISVQMYCPTPIARANAVRGGFPYDGTPMEQADFCAANPELTISPAEWNQTVLDAYDLVMATSFDAPPVPFSGKYRYFNTHLGPDLQSITYGVNEAWHLNITETDSHYVWDRRVPAGGIYIINRVEAYQWGGVLGSGGGWGVTTGVQMLNNHFVSTPCEEFAQVGMVICTKTRFFMPSVCNSNRSDIEGGAGFFFNTESCGKITRAPGSTYLDILPTVNPVDPLSGRIVPGRFSASGTPIVFDGTNIYYDLDAHIAWQYDPSGPFRPDCPCT